MQTAIKSISKISESPVWEPDDIQHLMQKLRLEERGFALVMNVSPMTVRLWLCGASQPRNTSSRLMQIYTVDSEIINRLCEAEQEDRK